MAYFCFVYVNSMSVVLALKLWSLALSDIVLQVLGLVSLVLVSQVLVNITAKYLRHS